MDQFYVSEIIYFCILWIQDASWYHSRRKWALTTYILFQQFLLRDALCKLDLVILQTQIYLSCKLKFFHGSSESAGSNCVLTANKPLHGLIGSSPRPLFLGDLGPLVLSSTRVRLLCSHRLHYAQTIRSLGGNKSFRNSCSKWAMSESALLNHKHKISCKTLAMDKVNSKIFLRHSLFSLL